MSSRAMRKIYGMNAAPSPGEAESLQQAEDAYSSQDEAYHTRPSGFNILV